MSENKAKKKFHYRVSVKIAEGVFEVDTDSGVEIYSLRPDSGEFYATEKFIKDVVGYLKYIEIPIDDVILLNRDKKRISEEIEELKLEHDKLYEKTKILNNNSKYKKIQEHLLSAQHSLNNIMGVFNVGYGEEGFEPCDNCGSRWPGWSYCHKC